MDLLRELVTPRDLVYILPVALAGMWVILRRVGFEVDVAGVFDALFGDEKGGKRTPFGRLWRFLFPTQGMSVVGIGFFVFGWASTGLTLNHAIREGSSALIFTGAVATGFWTAVLGTRLFHWLLPTERGATRMEDLVGLPAIVISDTVDAEHGRARVVDATGNTITVFCRLVGVEKPPQTGSRVILVAYDPKERLFDVTPG